MFDLISVGDATIDKILTINQATVSCQKTKQNCQLSFDYPSKVVVDQLDQSVAGNSMNVAVGTARLGFKTSFFSIIGNDQAGNLILDAVTKEKVDASLVQIDRRQPTNYSVVINVHGDRTILVYHAPRRYHWLKSWPESKWLYLSSMGQGSEVIFPKIVAEVRKNKTKLAFNPGSYQLKLSLRKLKPIFKVLEILFVNKQEAELLLSARKNTALKKLMLELAQFGIKKVVITDGTKGAWVYDSSVKKLYFLEASPEKPIESTGAGDSFATGLTSGLMAQKNILEAMHWGMANAGSVIGQAGPQRGLLPRRKLERIVKKYQVLKSKVSNI